MAELMRIFSAVLMTLAFMPLGTSAQASMNRSLLRSPEALAMGGAYTAIVDDIDAPFYNPAGVAAIDHLSVHLVSIAPTVSDWVVSGWSTLSDLSSPSGADINRLMGQNIYVQTTATAAVLAPGFALVGLYDVQGALYAKNQALPKIEYGYQTTSGVQAAFAFAVTDGRRHGRGKRNGEYLNEWRFGIGGKFLSRTGGYRLLSAAQLFAIDSTNTSDLIGGQGVGYGLDLGVQRVQRVNPNLTLHWGAAFLNAGDVTFGNGATPLKGDLTSGVAVTLQQGIAGITFAYDIAQLNRDDDFSKKQNFGARLRLPLLDIYGGFHQGFLTYGAAFDFWITRIAATVYQEELGAYQKQNPESRMTLRADFKMEF